MIETCHTCRFWWWNIDYTGLDLKERTQLDAGYCHRRAPIGDYRWPATRRWHYCGEYEIDGRLRNEQPKI